MNDARYHDLCRAILARALDAGELVVDDELLYEVVFWQLEDVFRHYWDTCSPGAGAGVDQVVRIGDLYLPRGEYSQPGPFDSLEEAVHAIDGEDGIGVSTSSVSIGCTEWDEEEIIRRMIVFGDLPRELRINGRVWPYETLEHRMEQLGGRWA